MWIIRVAVIGAIAACAAVGLAGPAQAQGDVKTPGVPEGVYTVNVDGQATTEWTIYPICVPTVGDLRDPLILPVGCRLQITPKGLSGATAVQIGGRWSFQYDTLDGRTCPDGTKAPQTTQYSFDGFTLAGNIKVLHGGECGDLPAMTNTPFTMAFNRPQDIPVQQYPLLCEPGGIRRCF